MKSEATDVGADESVQPEPALEAGEQKPSEKTAQLESPFVKALMQVAKDEGSIEDLPERDSTEDDEPPDDDEDEGPPPEDESEEGSPEGEEAEEEAEQPVAAKGEEWAPSAKKRVAEETEKRKRAIQRADSAEGEVRQRDARIAELESQLVAAQAPRPTPFNPFADISDPARLDAFEGNYEQIRRDAEKAIARATRDGEDKGSIVMGIDKDGKEIVRTFPVEELIELKDKADHVLRKSIPQRRAYIEARKEMDSLAQETYEDFKDPTSEFSKAADMLLQGTPGLEQVLGPQAKLWLGRALRGYQLELLQKQQAGKVPGSDTKRIVDSAKQKIAPTIQRTRAFSERRTGSDLAKATQKLEENGDVESAENYVAAALARSRQARNKVVPAG